MTTLSLFQHYLEYIRSPPVLLTILVIVGPVLLEIIKNRILPRGPSQPDEIQGCFRLGLTKRSNLDCQYKPTETPTTTNATESKSSNPRIQALFTYPIKSCRGVELAASEVVPSGLKYDRLFTFAQLVFKPSDSGTPVEDASVDDSSDRKHEWRFVTQRDFPRLSLVETELWVPDHRAAKKRRSKDRKTEDAKKSSKSSTGRDQSQGSPSSTPPTSTAEPLEANLQESWVTNGGCLIVRFPYKPAFSPFGIWTETVTIRLPLVPTSQRAESRRYSYETVNVWKDYPTAINLSHEVPSDDFVKLKYFLGVRNRLALFRIDDRNKRTVTRSLPIDRPNEVYSLGFGDAFPLHMLSIASVRATDQELPDNASVMKGKLDARRFRANIYLSGAPAYEEDSWKKITVGRGIRSRPKDGRVVETDGEYHVACRTARCKLPNVDQETGLKDVNEPDSTLRRTRKVDKGAYPHPCLGMQMIPLFQQGILRVGDEVHVIECGEHVYEKMFS